MRHFLANLFTYTIASMLFIGAAFFGAIRSQQYAFTDEATVFAAHEPARDTAFHWRELGRVAYTRNCANCHGAAGRGWDQYPPLQPTGELLHAPGGRDFLIDLHLYGLASDRWRAPMPRFDHMQDVELAAVLNWMLVVFGGLAEDTYYVPADIAARRGLRLTPREVDGTRPL
jgi:mono/diheme cytochrome c family protein